MGSDMRIGERIAPARYLLFIVSAALATIFASPVFGWHDGGLIGFDVGATAFLLSLAPLLPQSSVEEMRRYAAENDANRLLLLLITGAVVLAVLTAIALELARKGNPPPKQVVLIIGSLLLAWLFANSVFAMHYAHMYYLKENGGDSGGMDFPKTAEPRYWEFIYFAFCLGMTFQTSDTNITATRVRQVVTLHTMLAFIFNIGVIAFTINVLGGGGSATLAASH